MEAQKGKKKILFERLFNGNKRINALAEVKFFQKQTAGNNCPVCMTDRLNVRLRATEIRFAQLKEGKPLMLLKANSRVTFHTITGELMGRVYAVQPVSTLQFMLQLRGQRSIKGGKSSVRECLQAFSPPFPLQSPLVFFFFFVKFSPALYYLNAWNRLISKPTGNTVRNRTIAFTALTFIVIVKEVPFKG